MGKIEKYFRDVKKTPSWDRIPAISDRELDEILHDFDTGTQLFSFCCVQYEYTEDQEQHVITIGNRICGFILFDVPFRYKDGMATPVMDIEGSIKNRPTKTIVSISLYGDIGVKMSEEYFYIEPNISRVYAKHGSFAMPLGNQ